MAIQRKRAQLFVLKKGGEGSIVIEQYQVRAWQERQQGLQNVSCSPDEMAVEQSGRDKHGVPFILVRTFPLGTF